MSALGLRGVASDRQRDLAERPIVDKMPNRDRRLIQRVGAILSGFDLALFDQTEHLLVRGGLVCWARGEQAEPAERSAPPDDVGDVDGRLRSGRIAERDVPASGSDGTESLSQQW